MNVSFKKLHLFIHDKQRVKDYDTNMHIIQKNLLCGHNSNASELIENLKEMSP